MTDRPTPELIAAVLRGHGALLNATGVGGGVKYCDWADSLDGCVIVRRGDYGYLWARGAANVDPRSIGYRDGLLAFTEAVFGVSDD